MPTRVRVVRLDWDFWYGLAEADGTVEPGEFPELNADGRVYYLKHRNEWQESDQYFWPNSDGYLSLREAVAAAEEVMTAPVTWDWIDDTGGGAPG